jgi:hypothetical protein
MAGALSRVLVVPVGDVAAWAGRFLVSGDATDGDALVRGMSCTVLMPPPPG